MKYFDPLHDDFFYRNEYKLLSFDDLMKLPKEERIKYKELPSKMEENEETRDISC